MKATTYLLEDERGVAAVCIRLFRAAMTPPAPRPAASTKSGVFARLGRWLAGARQRDLERWLATSKDVFELEARLREAGRQPYFF